MKLFYIFIFLFIPVTLLAGLRSSILDETRNTDGNVIERKVSIGKKFNLVSDGNPHAEKILVFNDDGLLIKQYGEDRPPSPDYFAEFISYYPNGKVKSEHYYQYEEESQIGQRDVLYLVKEKTFKRNNDRKIRTRDNFKGELDWEDIELGEVSFNENRNDNVDLATSVIDGLFELKDKYDERQEYNELEKKYNQLQRKHNKLLLITTGVFGIMLFLLLLSFFTRKKN